MGIMLAVAEAAELTVKQMAVERTASELIVELAVRLQ